MSKNVHKDLVPPSVGNWGHKGRFAANNDVRRVLKSLGKMVGAKGFEPSTQFPSPPPCRGARPCDLVPSIHAAMPPGGVAVAVRSLCIAKIDAAGCDREQLVFPRARPTYSCDSGLGGLMMGIEAEEKSSRAIAEEAFHVKLGPRPAFPPSPAETGRVDLQRAPVFPNFLRAEEVSIRAGSQPVV